jgi:hypothetical protein
MGRELFDSSARARSRATLRNLAMPFLMMGAAACARPPLDARADGSWMYEVEAPSEGSRTVTVEATFVNARTHRIAIGGDSAPFVKNVRVREHGSFRTVERKGNEWHEPSCTARCTLRYTVDLGDLADACGDEVDCARKVGEATLSPALSWLVHPVPRNDVPVHVRVRTPDSSRFATGMHALDAKRGAYAFRSYDLDEGSFTAFGPMRRYRVDVPGISGPKSARLDVAVVGTGKFGMSDVAMKEWVADAASVVIPLFGRFPVERTTLFVVPAAGEDEVVFGKVLSLAGASIVLVVGDRMKEAERRRDWVLVHELFHLGFPTFRGEGRWLGEGLATYYEPVLRARAGWTSDDDVFRQFARNMPRGMPKRGSEGGLAAREDLDSIYWGGALFCFAADVKIREETRGKRSLDDVVRASLSRGGDATRVWTVAEVVRLGDEVTGTRVLSEMYERYAARGERIDLDGLLAALGIERTDEGSVELDEARPLAWVRRGIVGARPPAATAYGTPATLLPEAPAGSRLGFANGAVRAQ